jgi:hypothetical protein
MRIFTTLLLVFCFSIPCNADQDLVTLVKRLISKISGTNTVIPMPCSVILITDDSKSFCIGQCPVFVLPVVTGTQIKTPPQLAACDFIFLSGQPTGNTRSTCKQQCPTLVLPDTGGQVNWTTVSYP